MIKFSKEKVFIDNDCVFCKIVTHNEDSNIIYETDSIVAILDIDPINEGHVLLIPKIHKSEIQDIPLNSLLEMMQLSQKIAVVYKALYKADGYSIMQNGGNFCDFGHLHMHIFPRFKEDAFNWNYPTDLILMKSLKTTAKIFADKIKQLEH